jgi:hypothetical protein
MKTNIETVIHNLRHAILLRGYALDWLPGEGEPGYEYGLNGRTNRIDNTVKLARGMDDNQTAEVLAHELSHILLHDTDRSMEILFRLGSLDLADSYREVEAESSAKQVLGAVGLPTDISDEYLAAWGISVMPDEILSNIRRHSSESANTILGEIQ